MKATLMSAALAATMAFCCGPAHADCDFLKPSCSDRDCCGSCEPVWLCCQGQPKSVKTTRHCYDVECKYVCIPPVTLPECCWFGKSCDCSGGDCAEGCDAGCGNDCGEDCTECPSPGLFRRLCAKFTDCRIRKVHRMKKQEHDQQECVWEWKVVRMAPPGGDKCCDDSCGPPVSCCAPCDALSTASFNDEVGIASW